MKILIALGGNAILKHGEKGSAEEQEANIRRTSRHLVKLVRAGNRIVITHGNGPQVGDILLKNELTKNILPPMPLDICSAESQGMIGYMLQQAFESELKMAGLALQVVTVITRTLVDSRDPAFENPTKPVGPFYNALEASKLREERGWRMVNDSGRGYRRVVPSPLPMEILEKETIARLFEMGMLVIGAGGGGIPVIQEADGTVKGVEAVLDKDRTAALLAAALHVDCLLILTDVERVYLNYSMPNQKPIDRINLRDCERYLAEGQFPPGSMGPKIESAVGFLRSGGERVIITSLELAEEALESKAGTTITA